MAVSERPYTSALAVSSQFFFCSLPLRLDTYNGCSFGCQYCFAKNRGGYSLRKKLKFADVAAIGRRFERVRSGAQVTILDEMLKHGVPIHFGGMSDPFTKAEREHRKTYQLLRLLNQYQYPTVISTKGTLILEDRYLKLIKEGKYVVQVSVSLNDDQLGKKIDYGAPLPSARFKVLETLAKEGVPTTCRIQPMIPTLEHQAFEIIDRLAGIGVDHVSVEHLKLGVETSWRGVRELSEIVGLDLPAYYRRKKAKCQEREWVLPVVDRLDMILKLREKAALNNISFGCGDNDLLLLSQTTACCSGVDQFIGFENHYKYNYIHAMRQGLKKNRARLEDLDHVWHPKNSVHRYVNPFSRIRNVPTKDQNIEMFIYENWDKKSKRFSPLSHYGVSDRGEKDKNGKTVYHLDEELKKLAHWLPRGKP